MGATTGAATSAEAAAPHLGQKRAPGGMIVEQAGQRVSISPALCPGCGRWATIKRGVDWTGAGEYDAVSRFRVRGYR